jgi:hypothetical protein
MQPLRAFVRRSGDARLDRVGGSRAWLRVLFAAVPRAYRGGVEATVLLDLRRRDGRPVPWTLELHGDHARARPGAAREAAVTVRVAVADLLRIGAGELDAGTALLDGRLDVAGDFDAAMQVARAFGRSL